MQALQKWRSILILKIPMPQSTTVMAATETTQLAWFHSTVAVSEKWKNKFSFDVRGDQKPSKADIRFTVRQKRADAKKALNGILFNGGSSKYKPESFSKIEADYMDRLQKKSRIKRAHESKRVHHKKLKRKHRKENLFDDFDYDHHERIFYATFGKQGFRTSGKAFHWTGNPGWGNNGFEEHTKSETVSHPFIPGTYADRKILGLPIASPLRIEDVKAAFRSSALKWHPDRHQGPLRAEAEEKFKDCVAAYKSLCTALSTP